MLKAGMVVRPACSAAALAPHPVSLAYYLLGRRTPSLTDQ